jgi:hypothetical protein
VASVELRLTPGELRVVSLPENAPFVKNMGVVFIRTAPVRVFCPEENEEAIRSWLGSEVSTEAPAMGSRQTGRPEGSYVEAETFWQVWAMALDEGASARRIADVTDADAGLVFVNRDKAGVIVKAVASNRGAARRALAGRKTPKGFSATPYGIKLPMPKPA